MKITWLGTGNAFTLKNSQSNALIEVNGKHLLWDCGGDARFALRDLGKSHLDIDAIYISHCHNDHIGGLEWLAFATFFDPRYKVGGRQKPTLFLHHSLVDILWSNSLSGGLRSLQARVNTLDTYFNVVPVKDNGSFVFEEVEFKLVQSIHIMDGFTIMPCFGLMCTIGKETIFWTSDTQHCPTQISDFYNLATVIFHDCETTPFCSGVHANLLELQTLPKDQTNKMWLIHYQDNVIDAGFEDQNKIVVTKGFRGFVKQFQEFEFGC